MNYLIEKTQRHYSVLCYKVSKHINNINEKRRKFNNLYL